MSDLLRFYDLLERLNSSQEQGLKLTSYIGSKCLPARGVYFFREPGEQRSPKPATERVVRVGTHAVSLNSKATLWQRLRMHMGTRSGFGNHRGSIFRSHVGAAMLARGDVVLPTWGVGSSAPLALRESPAAQEMEFEWEKKVSEHIGSMTVLWVNVPDQPGPASMRALIERNAIALLSNRFAPIEPPSNGWLGHYSPQDSIRRSGLWNLNYVNQAHDPKFLDVLQLAVEKTLAQESSEAV